MIAPDTSVVIAAFASWHENHGSARDALREGVRLIGHVAMESFAVLTRLPPPHRAAPDVVLRFLSANFPPGLLVMSSREHRRFLDILTERGISGGSTYDAFIAATALRRMATLVTLDRRALSVYEAIGARCVLLD